uniref:Transmembrane protein n=1 Tax=Clandestinovirus TaxID=2831644 RepID=A0A8F8KQK6_9VIRU|nr:transmembrane protein [Clandestinovirus]
MGSNKFKNDNRVSSFTDITTTMIRGDIFVLLVSLCWVSYAVHQCINNDTCVRATIPFTFETPRTNISAAMVAMSLMLFDRNPVLNHFNRSFIMAAAMWFVASLWMFALIE